MQKAKETPEKYVAESYMVKFNICKADAEAKLAAEKKKLKMISWQIL